MLKLYTWSTQNARKISIMLEECGLAYEIIPVNIEKGEQFKGHFKHLNPNGKIPVLLDPDLVDGNGNMEPVYETGAILLYLAEKSGQFISDNPAARMRTIKWLFWQTSNLGPVLGNFSHYASALASDEGQLNNYLIKTRATAPNMQAIERFTKESLRLLAVLNQALAGSDYISGDISIADFAAYPWIESVWQGFKLLNPKLEEELIHIVSWMERLASRPELSRGMHKLAWGTSL